MIASFGEDDVHDGAHMGAQRTAGGTKPVIIISAHLLSSSLSFEPIEPLALLPSAYHSELL